MAAAAHVRVTHDEGDRRILHVVIDRPERRNAIAAQTADELRRAWEHLESSQARVAILSGAGDQAFSSGADRDSPPRDAPCFPGTSAKVTKPIISAVTGWCVGLGVLLAQSADLCVADETAHFTMPELRIGKVGAGMLELIPRLPAKWAFELLLDGDIDATRAHQIGLVNWVVPAGRHLSYARDLAARLAEFDPQSVGWLKEQATALVPRTPSAVVDSVALFQRRTLDGEAI